MFIYIYTYHLGGGGVPGEVVHSGRGQVMLVGLRDLLQRILMWHSCIHAKVPKSTHFHFIKSNLKTTSAAELMYCFFVLHQNLTMKIIPKCQGSLFAMEAYLKKM